MKRTIQVSEIPYFPRQIGSKVDPLDNSSYHPHFWKSYHQFRLLSWLDSSLRRVAILFIKKYQHHISPKKGYSCSHRITYGGDSCSQYVKRTLMDTSLFETTLLAKARFEACNDAYRSFGRRETSSKGSLIISAGPNSDPITACIFAIVGLIFAAICGGGKNPCK